MRVASLWTRDEYYELVADASAASQWTLVKAQRHPYEMPPFAIATADVNDHPDPLRRWEPTLEGVYRVKPLFDRERSLGRFLAEQSAIPLFWVQLSDGSWELDAGGGRVELTADAANARALPEGASLHKIDFELEPAFVEFLRMSAQDLQAAAPDTGVLDRGEAGPNTQPHTLNILLGSRNVQVLQLKRDQAAAVRTMLRNMALVMSKPLDEGGFGEPVWVFAKSANGRLLRESVVGVDPGAIPSLDIEVWVDPWSQSQRVAIQEHGRARLNDPLDPLDSAPTSSSTSATNTPTLRCAATNAGSSSRPNSGAASARPPARPTASHTQRRKATSHPPSRVRQMKPQLGSLPSADERP